MSLLRFTDSASQNYEIPVHSVKTLNRFHLTSSGIKVSFPCARASRLCLMRSRPITLGATPTTTLTCWLTQRKSDQRISTFPSICSVPNPCHLNAFFCDLVEVVLPRDVLMPVIATARPKSSVYVYFSLQQHNGVLRQAGHWTTRSGIDTSDSGLNQRRRIYRRAML